MQGKRCKQVGELLKREIGSILLERVRDPKIGFITVTAVTVTRDLRLAKIHVSVLGNEEQKKQGLAALRHAIPFIRNEIGQRVALRFLPELQICEDQSIDRILRIESLLHDVGLDSSGKDGKDGKDGSS
ncbi:30S ribosome-binding factor RbfA [bacterium]|nr:30S ribosome-binding factor RbfA [bacterium]